MSNRIAEAISIVPVIAPVSQASAGNTTGAYVACPPALGTIDFVLRSGALAAGKALTIQVFQADDANGTNATEIEGYETVFTAPEGGVTDNTVIVSVDNGDVTAGFVTIEVSNDAASAVLIDAFAMERKQYLD